MPTDMPSRDLLVFGVIILIVGLLVVVVDFIIFCYWLSFKYKEYSYQQAYGPVITFPPRESDQYPGSLPEQTSSIVSDLAIAPSITLNAQSPSSLPFAPPEFDFLPAAVTSEEQDADEQPAEFLSASEVEHIADEQLAEHALASDIEIEPSVEPPSQYLIDASQHSIDAPQGFVDDRTGSSQEEYPTLPADPLEDFRPIDPAVLGAFGGIRSPFASTWSLVHPYVGLQVVLVAVTIFSLILFIPKMFSSGPNIMTTPYGLVVLIVSLFMQNAGFVGITAYLLKGYGTSLYRIGLRGPTGREVALGLLYGAGICLAAMLLEKGLDVGASHIVSRHFMDRMGKLTDQLSAGGQFEQIHSVPMQIWFIVGGAIAAPIGEEVFFRGLLYNSLKKRWGIPAGVVLSGICFGLIHFAPVAVIIIIPMGCVLALVYERTKSLWVTILMHAVNNGAQLLYAMYTMNHAARH